MDAFSLAIDITTTTNSDEQTCWCRLVTTFLAFVGNTSITTQSKSPLQWKDPQSLLAAAKACTDKSRHHLINPLTRFIRPCIVCKKCCYSMLYSCGLVMHLVAFQKATVLGNWRSKKKMPSVNELNKFDQWVLTTYVTRVIWANTNIFAVFGIIPRGVALVIQSCTLGADLSFYTSTR